MDQSLPAAVRAKLASLSRRMQRLRIVRVVSWLVLGLLILQAAWFVVDLTVGLEPAGFRLSWLSMAAFGLAFVGLAYLRQRLRPWHEETLAALIENHHPELGERLLSAVELSRRREAAHGSPALIAELIRSSDEASRPIDFADACPAGPTRKLAVRAALAAALALVALLLPAWADFQKNLWLAWFLPAQPFALELDDSRGVAVKNQPLTVAVRWLPLWPRATRPDSCTLVVRQGAAEKRLPMSATADVFVGTLMPFTSDVVVHAEASGLVSSELSIKAIDALAFVSDFPILNVDPPPYINPSVQPKQKLKGGQHHSIIENSSLTWHFETNRPLAAGMMIFERESSEPDAAQAKTSLLLQKSAGNLRDVQFPGGPTGKYHGILVGTDEYGLEFRLPLPSWTIWADAPPYFAELPLQAGQHSGALRLGADDFLPLKIAAEDTVGLAKVEVEYQINGGPVQTVQVANLEGKTKFSLDYFLSLAGKVKNGDELSVRLKVTDNRRLARGVAWMRDGIVLPAHDLGPQSVYYPPATEGTPRWFSFHIAPDADPLAQQNVIAQRNEVDAKIAELIKNLEEERNLLSRAKYAAHHHQVLDRAKEKKIDEVRKANAANQEELRKFAYEMGADPYLQLLAERPLALAQGELARSDANLAQTKSKTITPEDRDLKFQQTDRELVQALAKLDELKKANQQLAQDRLDQARIEALAQKQQHLAQKAAELAKLDLAKNPQAKAELARLQQEQARIAAELEKLSAQSKFFQEAMQQARVKQAKDLAQAAQQLAQSQRELMQASQKALADKMPDLLGELAQRQEKLAGQAATLGKEAKLPPGFPPPAFREARQAALSLRKALIEKALDDQEKTLHQLRALEDALAKNVLLGRTPKEGAGNLVRFQDLVQKELWKLGEDFPRLTSNQVRERLLAIVKSQSQVSESVGRLDVPKNMKEAVALQALAQAQSDETIKAFKLDALTAYEKMKEVLATLENLARTLPVTEAKVDPQVTPHEKLVRAQADQAHTHFEEQKDIRDQVLKLLAKVAGEAAEGKGPLGAVSDKQKELDDKTAKLQEQLMNLSQSGDSPKAKKMGDEASHAADQAQKAMAQSKENMKEGKLSQAAKDAEDAALKLEIAGRKAEETAKEMAGAPLPMLTQNQEKTAQDLNQAKKEMAQAQQKLQDGQPKSAQPSMQKAAKSLQQTAQAVGKQITQSRQPKNKFSIQGKVGLDALPPDSVFSQKLLEMGGKSWGELPGELKTRLVQDMRARYGDDYARIIQRYFEQVADPKK